MGLTKNGGGYNEKCVKICRVDLFESRQVRNQSKHIFD